MLGQIESLESRLLFAGADISTKGTLSIVGSRKADTIYVTYGPDALDLLFVQVNKSVFSFVREDVKRITIQAGASADHIEYRAFALNPDRFRIASTIYGSTGDDRIIGGGGPARIYGGTGNENIVGNFSRDIIYGEEGDDTIDGGQGADYISGGANDDELTGGLGFDRLFGDEGNDTFFARDDLPFDQDDRPGLSQSSFDALDGGGGRDSADADAIDRLVSIESTFRAP
jgi:Ca2+-binding RTX toxin-like protein